MSKKFKSQASSSRAAAGAFGSFGGFSNALDSDGRESSALTYITEPPDLSRISDQRVVIAYKNLLKKDETTRTKALDELKDFIGSVEARKGTLDDGFLEAWVKVYPRASIDLSRRVRQLAHTIMGLVAGLVGKRIAPFIPKVVGAWLAGLYDSDRPVHRSALDSLTIVFSTEAKRSNLWKFYQKAILDFVEDVLLHQTSSTLSDERTVKSDDAKAKYARVVGAGLLLFNRILGNSSDEELQKNAAEIGILLGNKALWAFCAHEDPFVRRSAYILLRSAVSREPAWIDWQVLSSCVIAKSLSIAQLGSASELSESLLLLTSSRPQVWTDDYSGKTSASKRLRQYIQRGSQGGHASFWSNLDQIIRTVPHSILAGADKTTADEMVTIASASILTETLRDGLTSREEPRQNLHVGWKTYVKIASWLLTILPQNEGHEFIETQLFPLVAYYVQPSHEKSKWSLPPQFGKEICVECITSVVSNGFNEDLEKFWATLSDNLLTAVKVSAPEQSKDFKASQDSISSQAMRQLSLVSAVLPTLNNNDLQLQAQNAFDKATRSLLEGSIQVLCARNGKPYSAAGVVEECVKNQGYLVKTSPAFLNFIQKDAPELLFSPSGGRLIAIILACKEWDDFSSTFENVVEKAMELEPEQANAVVLQSLLSSLDFNEIENADKLSSLMMKAVDRALDSSDLHWSFVIAALQNKTSKGQLRDRILLRLLDALSEDQTVLSGLHGFYRLGEAVPSAIRELQTGENGSKLSAKLLYLAESPSEDVASLAESLIQAFKDKVVGETSAKSKIEILQNEFTQVSGESLSIESLLLIGEELARGLSSDAANDSADNLLPPSSAWEVAMRPFLLLPPRPSLALTSPLLGAVHLVNNDVSESLRSLQLAIPRDSNHYSAAFRLASYSIRALSSFGILRRLSENQLKTLIYYVPLAVQLIDDDLSIEHSNDILGLKSADQREDYVDLVIKGRQLISGWTHDNQTLLLSQTTVSFFVTSFWEGTLENLSGNTPLEYRVGEAFTKIMTSVEALENPKPAEEVAKICREARTANGIRSASWFAVLRSSILSSTTGSRICNEMVADSTGLKPDDPSSNGLRKLVLLNVLLSEDSGFVSTIPTQRLVFLAKHLIECAQAGTMSLALRAEILRTLALIIPGLAELYGSHWEDSMDLISGVFREINGGEEGLPLVFSAFKIFANLKSLADGESNDDLKDAWMERKTGLFNDVASTISKFDSDTTYHQPRDVVVDLLGRLINSIPVDKLEDVSGVFGLLTAQSRSVQRAAYTILHRFIPQAQEQVSFDVALSKTSVSLPDELVSLLLEPPTAQTVQDAFDNDKSWITIRAYLLSWKLVFDHFSHASLPVREHYAANISENEVLIPLLEFTFDFLQRSHGRIVDASKFNVADFEVDQSENPEGETQWLLIHLYYLCLRHLANPTKNWWIDTKKRTKGPVEAWTEKHISPLVSADSLQGVMDWISTQDANEERALNVKISPKTAEIIASIPVDEESPPVSISISLPPAYPLHPAQVVGRSRVLVDEKKWKSWLLTIQGVIMFANGNLVDGLLAFRRNVQGALKGQSECAICYSVISTDMQTPNKRCATCKNTFHSVCLFRWFKSSNQSTCPLCRNNFVYV